jgi:hypothetical protein
MKKDYALRFAMILLHTIYLIAALPILVLQTLWTRKTEMAANLFHQYYRHWGIFLKPIFIRERKPNSYSNYYQHISFK